MSILFLLVVLVGIVMVGGFVLALVLATRREQGRKAALQSFAQAGGWTFVERDDRWVGVFAGTPFGQGSDRHADDVIDRVVSGQRQVACTYRFTTYETVTSTDANGRAVTTQQRRDHAFQVLAASLPAALGPVAISRERLGDRLLRAFGGQDIDIEHADFNRRYRVRADDPKLAVDLLNPRTVERLLTHEDASMRIAGGWVVVVAPGQLVPEFVEDRLRLVADLLAGVPRFVWLDHGFQPEQV